MEASAPAVSGVAVDLDGDGDRDLAGGEYSSPSITVFSYEGSSGLQFLGNFFTTNALPASVVPVDLDRDGDLDLAVGGLSTGSINRLSILLNQGDGRLSPPTNPPKVTDKAFDPWGVLAGDHDGDGDMDIALWRPSQGVISLFSNQGNGSLAPFRDLPFTSGFARPFSGDFDGDGDLDFL